MECLPHHGPLPGLGGGHAHGHSHEHEHGHAQGHAGSEHRPAQRRALLLALALTATAFVGEVIGGLWTGSLMLLSDAAHMLSHAVALGVSYAAIRLASRPRSPRSHFGLHRAEVLGAFLNGLGLLVFTGWIVFEAVQHLLAPTAVAGAEMTVIAVLGLLVNLATAWILHRAGAEDLNTRSAFLHMLADTFSSAAIVLGGAVLWATGWSWIDPLLSLVVAGVILVWGVGLLRRATSVLLERAPEHMDLSVTEGALLDELPEVLAVHDLHVWEITTGYICLTAHLVVADARLSEVADLRRRAAALVQERFHVGHATFQIEVEPAAELAPESTPESTSELAMENGL